jgi:hypothetical protein
MKIRDLVSFRPNPISEIEKSCLSCVLKNLGISFSNYGAVMRDKISQSALR